jgi:hypothetical protein
MGSYFSLLMTNVGKRYTILFMKLSGQAKIITPKVLIIAVITIVVVGFIFARWQGANNCTSVEKYDAIKGQCYFECDSDQQCQKLSKQVDAELNQNLAQSQTKTAPKKPAPIPTLSDGSLYNSTTTGSETKGTVYTVTPHGLQPSPTIAHQNLWQLVNKLIGNDVAQQRLLSFEVFDDGKNDTAAAVWRSDNPAKWHMSVNQAFASQDKKDLIRTVIHEYGHILTLSDNQVGEVQGACPRLELSEGCANGASYINSYHDQFWKNYGLTAGQAGELSQSDAANLYASEPQAFVSEYASTNITEDLAESFADFVVKAKPTGSAIKDQKTRFFYNYPELVALREKMRAAAATAVL